MKKLHIIGIILTVLAIAGLVAVGWHSKLAVLTPQGTVAAQQRSLMLTVFLLMLIVVIPVFILLWVIAWKYRDGNAAAKYQPEWTNNKLELIWWGIPLAIIATLGVIIVQSSHSLDPYRPLQSNVQPLTVQVVALDWKWLFIYPDQHIATVNYLRLPAHVPVNFQITADAPMNSFWIPQLGGQIYAMPGMSTSLHLIADHTGSFAGSSVNISGRGYAGMKFTTDAVDQADFNSWVASVQKSPQPLDRDEYLKLSAPTENDPVQLFSLTDTELYNQVVMKYMPPITHNSGEQH